MTQLKYLIASVPKAGTAAWAVKPLNWFGKLPRIVWERPVFPVACFPLHIMGIDSLFFFFFSRPQKLFPSCNLCVCKHLFYANMQAINVFISIFSITLSLTLFLSLVQRYRSCCDVN